MMKRRYQLRILLACLFPLYLFYGCETVQVRQEPLPGSPVAHAPKMVVGDSWTVKEYTNKYKRDVVTIKIIKVESDGSYTVEKVRKEGGKRWIRDYDSLSRRINPPEKKVLLNFPLFIGKKWKDKYLGKSTKGGYYNYKNTYIVKKYEKVNTKTGNFSAFKILQIQYNVNTNWQGRAELWYAPEVKKIVKYRPSWRYGFDLISYKLATDKIAKHSVQQKITPQPLPEKSKQHQKLTETDKPIIIMESERIKVGIIEFQNLNEEAKKDNLGKVVSEMLTTAFVNSEAFKIIEREQLQKILKEFKLSQSGIIDTSDAKKIGKIAGATAIVTGSVVKMGDYIRLDARIIDVESGIILIAEKNEGPTGIKSIGAMVDQIVSNFVNKFYQENK